MKKIIILLVIVIMVIICFGIYLISLGNSITTKNKVLEVQQYISNKNFSQAQTILDSLAKSSSTMNAEEKQLALEIKNGFDDEAYNNLKPFLSNHTLTGKVNENYEVTILLTNAKKSNGYIFVEEYYNKYPTKKLALKIISDGTSRCTIDELCDGNPSGIYNLSFDGKTATGTYEYAPTGKIIPVTLTFNN